MLYRIALIFALFTTFAHAYGQTGQTKAENDPWKLWNEPGVHAIMRHATAPGMGDPPDFTLGKCGTQRDLDSTGREEAKALGARIRDKGIKLSAVYSSQWCRCLHTAEEMAVGQVQELPALNSFFQGRGNRADQTTTLREHIASLGPGDKVLYVSHQVNTTALTGVFPDSGEVILFKLNAKGEIDVVGRVPAID